jgi:hypothetical protein
VGCSPTLGLASILGPVVATTIVEAGVIMGHLAFPTATTSPLCTTAVIGAIVTALLVLLSVMILGQRRTLLLLFLLLASQPLLLGEEQLAIDKDEVGRWCFHTVVHSLEPPHHLLNGQGRGVQEIL